MPKVFLSHSSKDTKLVQKINSHFKRCLIKTWLDESDMPGGSHLRNTIEDNIAGSTIFMPLISQNFCESNWCNREWNFAIEEEDVLCIPIMLIDEEFWKDQSEKIQTFLKRIQKQWKYINFDTYQFDKSIEQVEKAIWTNEPIRIHPIQVKEISGQTVQEIEFEILNQPLPTNMLKTWDIRLEDHISTQDKDGKSITRGIPVAFAGRLPNWIYTYLSIPFYNKRTVYIYNQVSNEYICVYSPEPTTTGTVLSI